MKEEIKAIAVRHQLVSDYTSLVAVDEAILRPESEMFFQKRYDPTLPLGWQEDQLKALEAEAAYRKLQEQPQADGSPRNELLQPISLPQTATGFRLYLLFGLSLILAGSALLLSQRRMRFA